MNKKIKIMLLGDVIAFLFLVFQVRAASDPTWTKNVLMNAGQHKSIVSGATESPGQLQYTQIFNTAFANAPRVVLSFEGYKQDARSSSSVDVGFKVEVISVDTTTFTQNITIYGADIHLLYYNYMGVDYSLTDYFISFQCLQFSTGNLADATSSSRTYSQIRSTQSGQNYTNFGTNQIIMQGYLTGYLMNMGTSGTYITLTIQPFSSNSYNLTIKTSGDVQIYQVTYYRFSFDKTQLQSTYVNFITLWKFEGVNSNEIIDPANITADQFQYRNFIMGFTDIQIADPSLQRDFLLQLVGTSQIIYNSVYSFPTYQYLYAIYFHLTIRQCSSAQPYYLASDEQCHASCPSLQYFQNTNGDFCDLCHYSCLSCSWSGNDNCTSCPNATFRTINNNYCNCDDGYFDNNTALCVQCDSVCLTCQTTSTTCLSCNSTQNRVLSGSDCVCDSSYIQNNGICQPVGQVCGDGYIVGSQECDDYNTVNSDGCSSVCAVQTSHTCQTRTNGTSLCYYSQKISMSIQSIIKEQYKNEINIIINIIAPNSNQNYFKSYLQNLQALQVSDSRRLLQTSTVLSVISAQYSSSTNLLDLILQYSESISALSNKKFSFVPSQSSTSDFLTYFFDTPSTVISLEEPHNNIPIIYYSETQYTQIQALTGFYIAIVALNLTFLLGTIIMRKTAIAVECLLVTQIAYMFLLGQESVQIGFAGLGIAGKYLMGFNANFLQDFQTCSGMQALSLQCNSIDNINITAYITMVCFFVCVGLQLFRYKKQRMLDEEVSAHNSQTTSRKIDNNQQNIQEEKGSSAPTIKPPQEYKLPDHVQIIYSVCHQLSTAFFFLFVMCFWATACFQNEANLIGSIVWDIFFGLSWVGMWVFWFMLLGSRQFSYWSIVTVGISKISIMKLYYPIIFAYISVLSILLALVIGYASYALTMVYAILLIMLIVKKNMYKKTFNQIRAIINNSIIIIICIIFIIADAVDIETGIGASIALGVILFLNLIFNLAIFVYQVYYEYKINSKQVSIQEEQSHKSNHLKEKQIELMKQRRQGNTPMMTQRKMPLLQQGMKTVVKEKVSELKSFKEKLKMTENKTDQEKAKQILTAFDFAKIKDQTEGEKYEI